MPGRGQRRTNTPSGAPGSIGPGLRLAAHTTSALPRGSAASPTTESAARVLPPRGAYTAGPVQTRVRDGSSYTRRQLSSAKPSKRATTRCAARLPTAGGTTVIGGDACVSSARSHTEEPGSRSKATPFHRNCPTPWRASATKIRPLRASVASVVGKVASISASYTGGAY